MSLCTKIVYINNFLADPKTYCQMPSWHAQMRRRRRRETVTRMSTARTRRCTENSQIPGKRKPNGTGRGFLQGHTRGAITPAPFVQTTSGCRATVPRTPRPARPPPFSARPTLNYRLHSLVQRYFCNRFAPWKEYIISRIRTHSSRHNRISRSRAKLPRSHSQ